MRVMVINVYQFLYLPKTKGQGSERLWQDLGGFLLGHPVLAICRLCKFTDQGNWVVAMRSSEVPFNLHQPLPPCFATETSTMHVAWLKAEGSDRPRYTRDVLRFAKQSVSI